MALLFAALVALPLGEDFFEDYGWISGPVAWVLCSAGTAAVLSLRRALSLPSRAEPLAIVGVALDHTAGLIVAIAVFAAACAGYSPGGNRTRVPRLKT